MKNDYVELAKKFVLLILDNNGEATIESMKDILAINSGDEKILLVHLKAIVGIMNKAIKELEKGGNNE